MGSLQQGSFFIWTAAVNELIAAERRGCSAILGSCRSRVLLLRGDRRLACILCSSISKVVRGVLVAPISMLTRLRILLH